MRSSAHLSHTKTFLRAAAKVPTLAAVLCVFGGCEDLGLRISELEILADTTELNVGDQVRLSLEGGLPLAGLRTSPPNALNPLGDSLFEVLIPGDIEVTARYADTRTQTLVLSVTCETGNPETIVHTGSTGPQEVWGQIAGTVHIVSGAVTVPTGTLRIFSCGEIQFEDGASLEVSETASLELFADPDNPVAFAPANPGSTPTGIRLRFGDSNAHKIQGLTLDGFGAFPSTEATLELSGDITVAQPLRSLLANVRILNCAQHGASLQGVRANLDHRWKQWEVTGCQGTPLRTDAASVGSLPQGDLSGNCLGGGCGGAVAGADRIWVEGGWVGPATQRWLDLGVPYLVRSTISIAPDPAIVQGEDIGRDFHQVFFGGRFVTVQRGARFEFETGTGIVVGDDPTIPITNPLTEEWPSSFDRDSIAALRVSFPMPDVVRPEVRFCTEGSVDEPVVFTSASPTPSPGDWIGIVFLANGRVEFFPTQRSGLFLSGQVSPPLSTLMGSIVEYAGAPSGYIGPDGEESRAGVAVFQPLVFTRSGNHSRFLQNTVIRNNAGYGLYSPLSMLDPFILTDTSEDRQALGCVCENMDAEVTMFLPSLLPDAPANLPQCATMPCTLECSDCPPALFPRLQ